MKPEPEPIRVVTIPAREYQRLEMRSRELAELKARRHIIAAELAARIQAMANDCTTNNAEVIERLMFGEAP